MKKISEIFFRGKWLKKEEYIEKIKNITEEYSKELKKISDYNYELLEDKAKYYNLYKAGKEINEEHQVMNGLLRKENDELKQTIKQLRGAKGGLTKQVNKLTKELEETKVITSPSFNFEGSSTLTSNTTSYTLIVGSIEPEIIVYNAKAGLYFSPLLAYNCAAIT